MDEARQWIYALRVELRLQARLLDQLLSEVAKDSVWE